MPRGRIRGIDRTGSCIPRQTATRDTSFGGQRINMPFPTTRFELEEQGYRFNDTGVCRGCQATIEWWITPQNRPMPLDPGTFKPHWATCSKADNFRRKK